MNQLRYFLNPANWFFPPSRRYRLEVQASEPEISKVKDFAQAICLVAGYTLSDINVVKLVLEEVCANIIRHAYPPEAKGTIQLEMSIGFFGIRIRVTDQGQSFDYKSIKAPDIEHYVEVAKKGGLGLWVVRKLMNSVHYRATENYNEWTLFYRPTYGKSEEDIQDKASTWDGLSVKFIVASFFLFTFLVFLIYLLSALMAPAPDAGGTLLQRLTAEYKTNLGLGILLIYGLGLVGFAVIFFRLFYPILLNRPQLGWAGRWQARQTAQRDRSEYERLLSAMTAVDQKARDAQARLEEFQNRQDVLTEDQKFSEDKVRVLEADRKEFEQKFLTAQKKLKEYEDQNVDLLEDQRSGQQKLKEMTDKHSELEHFSGQKEDLERELKEVRARLANQEHIQEGMRKEVQVAQQIQHALLPKEYPQIEGFQVGASYRAASEVGGDYYDFIWVDPTTLGIAVGDVAGKGVPGSMVMAMIRTAMRLEAERNKSPATVLLKVHQHVNGDMKRGMFATMFYIVLDSRKRSISYASAGHNPMILYRRATDEIYFLKPKGFPLGIDLPDESLFAKTLALQKLSLQKDDLLLIYTDGVTEAMNTEREQFGDERMIQAIKDSAHLSASEIVQKLESKIADFVGSAEQSDDVTIVVIKENLQAEDVIYKFRKNLLNLVDVEGLSIAEACRRTNVSPKAYYYYKAIHDKKGDAGLKPAPAKRKAVVNVLSLDQQDAVLAVVRSNPELGATQIVEFLKRVRRPALKLDPKVVAEFLTRKGLGEDRERKVFAANEIDTI